MFELIVVGGGHAGCEAGYAAARLGLTVALITLDLNKLAFMSCNPSIGGPAKGHLTREIDALGGLQGAVTDATYLNLRMLNTGKGASVRALRAQSDRQGYTLEMQHRLVAVANLELLEGEVAEVLVRDGEAVGVLLTDGRELLAPRVVIAPGTFTRAFCILGDRRHTAGRWGESSAMQLGESLDALGITTHRLKTGTSPRIARDSVDFTQLRPQLSEWRTAAFQNYTPAALPPWFLPCWLTRTTDITHQLIAEHLHESAMFNGEIVGTGPRYCPSIEDKLNKFPDAKAHPVFVEPDGLTDNLLYLQGLSTALPLKVQRSFLATIPGLASAQIRQPGYAVEYDAINPIQLTPQLAVKHIAGLYCAGQFNGTSGYEEAAAQGLVAGANAALSLLGKEPLPLTRENSYIGVLVDDLSTRGTAEPYRMLTARCEHRLLLRHDNTATRLGPIARDWGLIAPEQIAVLDVLRQKIHAVSAELSELRVSSDQQLALGLPGLHRESIRGTEAVRRGGKVASVLWQGMARDTSNAKPLIADDEFIAQAACSQVQVDIQYAGYIERARQEIARTARYQELAIPADFDFDSVLGLLKSTREHLGLVRPSTVAQASRIPGVTPADVANLIMALRSRS